MRRKRSSNLRADKSGHLTDFPIMISGCLLGIRCRYDSGKCPSPGIIHFASSANVIPFCPEQLGGLSTPRPPARIVGGDGRDVLSGTANVINNVGEDVTDAYKRGAEESLRLARLTASKTALLKEKSPSCGLSTPYCEKPANSGMGVTAALFRASGLKVMGVNPERDFPLPDFLKLLREVYG